MLFNYDILVFCNDDCLLMFLICLFGSFYIIVLNVNTSLLFALIIYYLRILYRTTISNFDAICISKWQLENKNPLVLLSGHFGNNQLMSVNLGWL